MRTHMYTDWPGIYSYAQLNDRLFANPGRNNDHLSELVIHPPLVGIYPLPIWNGSSRGCTWLSFLAAGLVKLQ